MIATLQAPVERLREWGGGGRRLALLMAATLAVRLPFVVSGLLEPARFRTWDAVEYVALARSLGAGYLDDSTALFDIGLKRTPGYPLFLRLTGGTVHPILTVLAQLLLSALIVAVTYAIGRRLLGSAAATVAASVVALDPASAVHSVQLQPETLATAFLVAAVWLVVPRPHPHPLAHLGAGLLLGGMVLLRPIVLLLPVVVVPTVWFLWRHQRPLAASLAVTAGFALPVGAWTARNYVVAGVPTVSSILGDQLLVSGAAGAIEAEKGEIGVAGERPFERDVSERAGSGANSAERSRAATRVALRQIVDHPVGMVKNLAQGGVRTMGGPAREAVLTSLAGQPLGGLPYAASPTGFPAPLAWALLAVQFAFLAVVYVGTAAGCWVLARERRWAVLALLVGVVAYFALSAPGLAGHARYRVPATPFIALLAGAGFVHLRARARSSETTVSGRPGTANG